ncbi:Zfyve26 [Symbiodinium pilosum]|uniref:Zfyve26 protein n=1 Tax=Symbiodinium pilosum TaxID=2952 RepID=A0A812VEK7_SYMPI|nr:Zfyve26 [Symbiodinium pilosum]
MNALSLCCVHPFMFSWFLQPIVVRKRKSVLRPMFQLPGPNQARGRQQACEEEVPIVPISKPPDKWMRHQGSGGLQPVMGSDRTMDPTGEGCDLEGNTAAAKAAMQLTALEDRLQDAVQNMRQRSRLRRGHEAVCNRSSISEFQETTLANAVTFLTPPIHPVEMSRWSTLTDMVTLRKTTKARHTIKMDAMSLSGETALEEPKPLGGPVMQSEDKRENNKDRPDEPPAAEADQACDPVFEEEEEANVAPDVSYDKLTMDMSSICCGCSASQNLRSPSNLWPEDRQTHSIMPASPMALPSAAPLFCAFSSSSGRLSTASFYELLCFQEKYGSAESLISLLVRERRLAQACQYIFNEKADKRLWRPQPLLMMLWAQVILDFDPSLQKVQEYLNSVKDFLRDRRALDLLYSYEVFTKNFVNAGFLAISLFVQSSTWDARVGHLQNAEAHLGFARRLSRRKGEGKEGSADGVSEGSLATTTQDAVAGSGDAAGTLEASKVGIADIKRNLETVRIQRAVCEAMPTNMPQNAVLFGDLPAQCEVAELLMVNGHFKLALKVIEFLDLPAVELCIRASNQIATQQARCPTGSIAPVVKFLEAIPKLPPVEWDSLVSNVVNIWIIEKEELKADRSAASQLVPYIQDERCKMDALILIGNLSSAFQIAQRLGSMQDVLHINSRAQATGDQELLKQIATFMAYNPIAKKRS